MASVDELADVMVFGGTEPKHWHIRTDNMQGMGTFPTLNTADQAAKTFVEAARNRGYTKKQLAGGARTEQCDCWMGEYVLNARGRNTN